VSSNAESLAEAQFQEHSWCRAVYADEELVGFVMLYDDPTGAPVYSIWRLMIDERFQRRGFGRQVVQCVIEYVRSRPGASFLHVGATLGDGGPAPFYESLGFVPTGEVREDGEARYRLSLSAASP